MRTIHVRTESSSYPVICGRGSLARLGSLIDDLREGGEVFVLSSPRVWKFRGRDVMRQLADVRPDCVILFDDREAAKRLATIEGICRKLVRARADRQALLVAVGGGVVGDVAGFAASSYLRGVRIVHVPTTVVGRSEERRVG